MVTPGGSVTKSADQVTGLIPPGRPAVSGSDTPVTAVSPEAIPVDLVPPGSKAWSPLSRWHACERNTMPKTKGKNRRVTSPANDAHTSSATPGVRSIRRPPWRVASPMSTRELALSDDETRYPRGTGAVPNSPASPRGRFGLQAHFISYRVQDCEHNSQGSGPPSQNPGVPEIVLRPRGVGRWPHHEIADGKASGHRGRAGRASPTPWCSKAARPLDVAQVALLLGWTKNAVRAARSNRQEVAHWLLQP